MLLQNYKSKNYKSYIQSISNLISMKRILNKIYETPEIIMYSYHIKRKTRVSRKSHASSHDSSLRKSSTIITVLFYSTTYGSRFVVKKNHNN